MSPGPGARPMQPRLGGSSDAFLTAFEEDLRSIVFSTYLGGSSNDSAWGVALDPDGNPVVAGITVARDPEDNSITGSFIVSVLAAAFLGPASAAATIVIAELTATARLRTRWRSVVLNNLPAAVLAAVSS